MRSSRCTISLLLYHSLPRCTVLIPRCTISLPLYISFPVVASLHRCTIALPLVPCSSLLYHSLSCCTILSPLYHLSLRCTISLPSCTILSPVVPFIPPVVPSNLSRLFPLFSPLYHLHSAPSSTVVPSSINKKDAACEKFEASGLKRRRRKDLDLHPNRATAVPSLGVRVHLASAPLLASARSCCQW